MKDNTKKILVWSTIVAVLGVGGYFGYKAYKKKKEEKKAKEEEERLKLLAVATTTSTTSNQNTDNGSVGKPVNPFKNESEVKAFQDWLDKNHPLWINDNGKWKNLRVGTASEPNRHIGGKGYGVYGNNTASAYAKWGSEYVTTPTNIVSETGAKPNQDDIDKIKGNAYLTPSQKNGLSKRNPEFIKAWANAFRNDRTAFIWAYQVYRSKTGERVLDYDPYLKPMANKKGNITIYEFPTKKASSSSLSEGNVGLVRNYIYNEGNLWFYLPDNGGNYKWGIAEDFTRV